ncbi:MAG TPA: MFS transporter [Jatrophihabitans sp.]|nr:MFS transporter [Jatrophihabitans sp.]
MRSGADDGPGPLKHNGDFALLQLGNSVNDLGTAIGVIALNLIIYSFRHSPILVGVIDAVELITLVLCGLPAGLIADKLRTARVLATAAAAGALAYAAVAVMVVRHVLSVAGLVAVVILIGASSSAYAAASRTAVRRVVHGTDLATATSLIQARGALALVIGAPIGGLLYGWQHWLPLAFNAVSYLVAAGAALLVRRPMRVPGGSGPAETGAAAILAGLTFLWRCLPLRGITLVGIATGFASGGLLMSLIVNLQQRHYPYAVVGGVQSAVAAGMITGAILVPAVQPRVAPGRHLAGALLFVAGCFAVVAVAGPPWLILLALALGCLPVVPLVSTLTAFEASVVPAHLQGRVAAADRVLTDSASAVAPLAGGLLLQYFGHLTALLVFAGTMAAAAGYARADRHVRAIPARPLATTDPATAAVAHGDHE